MHVRRQHSMLTGYFALVIYDLLHTSQLVYKAFQVLVVWPAQLLTACRVKRVHVHVACACAEYLATSGSLQC